tara:strand:- start:184 stop:429 length:246 start_codon:yes stop_codon:yes gene_type:complete
MGDRWTGDNKVGEYVYASYKVPIGYGIMPQIRAAMIHLDCYTEKELEFMNDTDVLQMWVNAILDNQIDNDWERLGEIGERP